MQNHQSTTTTPLRRAALWTTLLASLTLAGCASLDGGNPEGLVSQRANERWRALVVADFTRAYSYNTPGFRAVVTPDAYRSRVGAAVIWTGAEAVRVDCPEPTKCNATVRIDFKPVLGGRSGGSLNTHIDETWLLEDGQWWIFQPIQGN